MIAPALLLLIAQEISVVTHEPRAAEPWTQEVTATCGKHELRVEDYGARKPHEKRPRILFDGHTVVGKELSKLIRDLSDLRAVYRLSILCAHDKKTMELRIVRGTPDKLGNVSYLSAAAWFRDGKLLDYASEASNADSFWYR